MKTVNLLKRIKNIIKYWGQILLLPLYLASHLIPRNKKIWVIGSTFGHSFLGNPRYFYLYLNQYQSDNIRSIWISKNKDITKLLQDEGYEAYCLYSLKGIWYCLRAKVYLYDNYSKDISFILSGRAVKVNLWHGIPLKKIQHDNINDKIRNPRNTKEKLYGIPRRLSDEKQSHYVLTTSKFLTSIFSSAFKTKKVINCGYPRNDYIRFEKIRNVLTKKEKEQYKIIVDKSVNACIKRKVILYMPTFRDSEVEFFDIININKFNTFLEENNYLFCIKLHKKSKLIENFSALKSDNIIILDSEVDPYVFLSLSDLLITDYSSIYFDYLFLDKPMIFFPYDLETYLNESREIYFDYLEFTPGIKVYTMGELMDQLSDFHSLEKDVEASRKRLALRNMIFDHEDEVGSEQLYEYINKVV